MDLPTDSILMSLSLSVRSHHSIICELSCLFMALTIACPIPFKPSGKHILGTKNTGADPLSWPQTYPTWASATAVNSQLGTCQAFRVPFKLLSVIATIVSSAKTGVAYEPEMTKLLTPGLRILATGLHECASTTSFSRGSHWSK